MSNRTCFYRRVFLCGVCAICTAFVFSIYQIQGIARAASPDIESESTIQDSLVFSNVAPRSSNDSIKPRISLKPPAKLEPDVSIPAIYSARKAASTVSRPLTSAKALTRATMEPVKLSTTLDGRPKLAKLPQFNTVAAGRVAGISSNHEYIIYSLDPDLQKFTTELVRRAAAPHVAIVVMEPSTGKILAMADKSTSIPELSLHAGFPAASLFKIVTSAAALEQSQLQPLSPIAFRGGTYTLDRWNGLPNPRLDRRSMPLAEALGRSCNPVFARVALKYLSPDILKTYADAFGFNREIDFDIGLPTSDALIPTTDSYEIGRTAAGFGEIKLSPIHAASIMSAIANGGIMPRPFVIDALYNSDGELLFNNQTQGLGRIVSPATAQKLLSMMQYTTTVGTSHREFSRRNGSIMNGMAVAAKTGTLRGDNPTGINHWFLATAPLENPRVAVSVISIDPVKSNAKSSYLGRMVMEQYFGNPNPLGVQAAPTVKRTSTKSKTKRRKK